MNVLCGQRSGIKSGNGYILWESSMGRTRDPEIWHWTQSCGTGWRTNETFLYVLRVQRVLGDYVTPSRITPWSIFETKVPFYHHTKQVIVNKDKLLSENGGEPCIYILSYGLNHVCLGVLYMLHKIGWYGTPYNFLSRAYV